MKKQSLLLVLLLAITSTVMAQSKSAFSNGDNLLNVGIGLGTPFFGTGYSASLPVNPTISFEHGFSDEISVGAQVSYASYKFNDTYQGQTYYSFKYNATYVGVRGSYHLGEMLELDSKFDVYGGGSLGYVVLSASDSEGYSGTLGSAVGYGVFGGGKYFFSHNAGIYAEVGYQSLSYLNVGLALKF
ncbi:MAG: hypothetical protein V4577_12600 [Bacteroidota bacterium]